MTSTDKSSTPLPLVKPITRRRFMGSLGLGLGMLPLYGCGRNGDAYQPELVWGERGLAPGQLQRPRAMTIDADDQLYLVDITGRIQVFDRDGNYLRGWRTPASKNGRPTGMSMIDGQLYVADTHYFRILVYSLDGTLNNTASFGNVSCLTEQALDNPPANAAESPANAAEDTATPESHEGRLGWVTDVVRDSAGNLFVSEYGEHDQIQQFAPDGSWIRAWGTHGTEPGQFVRPQGLWMDGQDRLWVCDAGNHRLQVFAPDGRFLFQWGGEGTAPGRLSYPYSLLIDGDGTSPDDHVYVCEYGNSRVQKLTPQGESIALWGTQGRAPGELHNPWSIARDSRGRLYVLDTYNHRVQRFWL